MGYLYLYFRMNYMLYEPWQNSILKCYHELPWDCVGIAMQNGECSVQLLFGTYFWMCMCYYMIYIIPLVNWVLKQHRQPYQRAQLILTEFPWVFMYSPGTFSISLFPILPPLMRACSAAYSKRVYIHDEDVRLWLCRFNWIA